MKLHKLCRYLDEYLRVAQIPDYSVALNGLQVESSEEVERIAVAVDAAQATIQAAIEIGADLLLVHHGLFWDGNQPVTGRRYRRLRALLRADVALYSAHLPLDVHPEVGNNAALLRALGSDVEGRFGEYKGTPLGTWGSTDLSRGELSRRLEEVLGGPVQLLAGGAERIRRVGVITGSGAGEWSAAVDAGVDALVTGEATHHNYFDAEEGGINIYLGGHYATETLGVKALARHVEAEFGIPWSFVDHPTGL